MVLSRVASGVKGFDNLTGGGFKKGSIKPGLARYNSLIEKKPLSLYLSNGFNLDVGENAISNSLSNCPKRLEPPKPCSSSNKRINSAGANAGCVSFR